MLSNPHKHEICWKIGYGQMSFCHSSFQIEEERFCKLLNHELYFISWSSKKRKWLAHHYSNLISFFDRYIGLWCLPGEMQQNVLLN